LHPRSDHSRSESQVCSWRWYFRGLIQRFKREMSPWRFVLMSWVVIAIHY
jgi:hypothetical protein